jgi:phage regulator Rha-like protein
MNENNPTVEVLTLLEVRHGKVYVDSLKFAQVFNVDHEKVVEAILKLIKDEEPDKDFVKCVYFTKKYELYTKFFISMQGFMILTPLVDKDKASHVEALFKGFRYMANIVSIYEKEIDEASKFTRENVREEAYYVARDKVWDEALYIVKKAGHMFSAIVQSNTDYDFDMKDYSGKLSKEGRYPSVIIGEDYDDEINTDDD